MHLRRLLCVWLGLASACDFACLTRCAKSSDSMSCSSLCECGQNAISEDLYPREFQTKLLQTVYEDNLQADSISLQDCIQYCTQSQIGASFHECWSACDIQAKMKETQSSLDTQNNYDDIECISECTDLCNQQPADLVTSCLEKCLAERCKITSSESSPMLVKRISISTVCGLVAGLSALSWVIAVGLRRQANKLKEPLLSIRR